MTMTITTYRAANVVFAMLDELGETGGAKVENGGLYTRREENCGWRYRSAVADETEARGWIDCFYATRLPQ